jgi:hypothetical protein
MKVCVLGCHKSYLTTEQWLGALDSVPLTISASVWNLSTHLVINHNLGAIQSSSAAISSVEDSDSVDPVTLIECNLPPLTNSILGMRELAWSSECPVWKVVGVAVVGRLFGRSLVQATLGVGWNIVGSSS